MNTKQYPGKELMILLKDIVCFPLPIAYCPLLIVLDQYVLFDSFDLIFGYGQISP